LYFCINLGEIDFIYDEYAHDFSLSVTVTTNLWGNSQPLEDYGTIKKFMF
jgi:hypothetical protein